jgi:hypothetical protein
MEVVSIGIIIRNNYGDTYPVALTTQMVGVIQNLLTQIPMMNQSIVGPDGMKAGKATPSIPIIPRGVEFDWEAAYKPVPVEEEKVLMAGIVEKYRVIDLERVAADEKIARDAGVPLKKDKPALLTDPDNPYNLELEGKGRSNVVTDIHENLVTDIHGNPVPPEDANEAAEEEHGLVGEPPTREEPEKECAPDPDCTITPDTLGMGAGAETPGG